MDGCAISGKHSYCLELSVSLYNEKNHVRLIIMSIKHFAVAGLLALGTVAPAASMAADAEAGKAISGTCVACHGKNGVSQVPIYPNLAGQKEKYLADSLKAYKNGKRQGGQAALMTPQAKGLSGKDIANLAAYYASLPAGGQ